MPAAVAVPLIVAGVGAASSVASSKMASNAQKRALAAQTHSADEAIAYQKQQDAQARADKAAAAANWQRQYDAYINRFYGGNTNQKAPAFSTLTPGPVSFPGSIAGGATAAAPPAASGGSVAGMVLGGPAGAPIEAAQFDQAALTPADMGGTSAPWNDWKRYLGTSQGA